MCERARVLRDAHMRLHEIRIWGERGRGIKSAFTDALSRCEEGGELKRGIPGRLIFAERDTRLLTFSAEFNFLSKGRRGKLGTKSDTEINDSKGIVLRFMLRAIPSDLTVGFRYFNVE